MTPRKEQPPFETRELRASLRTFLKSDYHDDATGAVSSIGSFRWGVYIFFDYDGEPIYVGQTKEKVSGRIGRHLTNQRTDAVAMSVLDPFEVCEIEIYPLPEFQEVGRNHPLYAKARCHLDALEYLVHERAKAKSRFNAILNEKDPPKPDAPVDLPKSLRGCIVSEAVRELRGHSDTRTARRAQIISRLSQTIAEREVKVGLRRTLVTQASRLRWLAEERFKEMGGERCRGCPGRNRRRGRWMSIGRATCGRSVRVRARRRSLAGDDTVERLNLAHMGHGPPSIRGES